jgi:UDP-N-acetylmuramyl tripeptide synthase
MRDNQAMHGLDRLVIVVAKLISFVSKTLGFGAGETWPGEVALRLRPHVAQSLAGALSRGCILVAGTNGKTTTSLMIKKTLEGVGNVVIHNETGANLLNGIVSSFIRHADFLGRITADVGIFEVDENSLPHVLRYMTPTHLVFLNLFRDQLDRYGEVDVIVEKWTKAIAPLTAKTTLIINADDPGVASLGNVSRAKVIYFGITDAKKFLPKAEHATDSTFCPSCGHRLVYQGIFFSHLGIWRCPSCGNTRPTPSVHSWPSALPGLYNEYNTLAAVATARAFGEPQKNIRDALSHFTPAFGRQEDIAVDGRTVKIVLSKNPAGFNASLRTVTEMHASHMLIVLNDRIPDGRDVSWIWDVDFEMIPDRTQVTVSGDRALDMAVRMKYADKRASAEKSLGEAVTKSIAATPKGKTLFVLATYSGMLEVRKLLTGRKIL